MPPARPRPPSLSPSPSPSLTLLHGAPGGSAHSGGAQPPAHLPHLRSRRPSRRGRGSEPGAAPPTPPPDPPQPPGTAATLEPPRPLPPPRCRGWRRSQRGIFSRRPCPPCRRASLRAVYNPPGPAARPCPCPRPPPRPPPPLPGWARRRLRGARKRKPGGAAPRRDRGWAGGRAGLGGTAEGGTGGVQRRPVPGFRCVPPSEGFAEGKQHRANPHTGGTKGHPPGPGTPAR